MKKLTITVLIATGISSRAQTLKPTETLALLNVEVINDTKKPLENEAVSFVSTKTKKIYSNITKANGKFELLVPKGDKYKVQYKAFTTNEDYSEVDIPNEAGAFTVDYTLTISPPKHYTLNNVFFDTGKSTLKPESSKELNQLAEYMTLKKSTVIEISGHTDNVGTPEANQKLSEERANLVRNFLIKKGIAAERVVAKGYGDTQPIDDNKTEAGRAKNRRTEVKTLKD